MAAARSPRGPANLRLAPSGERPGEPGHDSGGEQQGDGQDHRRRRQHPPHEDDGQHAHDHSDAERGDDPDDQILQRVDVLDHASQQVASAEHGQAGGGQPLESVVDRHPQVGEQSEGGVVAHQSLLVSEEAA